MAEIPWLRRSARRTIREPMPLRAELEPIAAGLYDELKTLYRESNSFVDFFFYNVGAGVSLAATGAAGVLASAHQTMAATTLSAIAAFFIAMTQILNFGGRWVFNLDRRARYADLIYELNLIPIRFSDESAWREPVVKIGDRLRVERRRDGRVPGAPALSEQSKGRPGAVQPSVVELSDRIAALERRDGDLEPQ